MEVFNDLDGDLINLFRVMQSGNDFAVLRERLTYTLHSRAEYELAIQMRHAVDPVERAWSYFVRLNQGFGGNLGATVGRWARVKQKQFDHFSRRVELFEYYRERFQNVQIDNIPAITCIKYWDSPESVFYVDPTYLPETRTRHGKFAHEMTLEEHLELIEVLSKVEGSVVLSGYPNKHYEKLAWDKSELEWRSGYMKDHRQIRRTETVWLNLKAQEKRQGRLCI